MVTYVTAWLLVAVIGSPTLEIVPLPSMRMCEEARFEIIKQFPTSAPKCIRGGPEFGA